MRKKHCICNIHVRNFEKSLTNDIVYFEQLAPVLWRTLKPILAQMTKLSLASTIKYRIEPSREETNNVVSKQSYTIWLYSRRSRLSRCLEFWIKQDEELFYPCSENKGDDYLCLCFRICRLLVFSYGGSIIEKTSLCI